VNNSQWLSLLRTVLQIAGTAIVAHGTLGINGAMWEQISGAVVLIAPTIWGLLARTDSANIATVEANDGVAKVLIKTTATDGTAAAAADPLRPKVVSVGATK
jgi:hypothetical protein